MLEISNLKKSYQKHSPVLVGIDLTIKAGEFVVIVGPSGAGKTTLIRCINQLVSPDSGEIFFQEKPTTRLKGRGLRRFRSQIGMIFQSYNLIWGSNVLQNVLHGRLGQMGFIQSALGLYSKADIKEAMDLLMTVGLGDFLHKKASTLSGGQMQRVGICRALMQRPTLLLADEPISSLDPAAATKVLDQILALTKARELTSIINLHHVDFAKKYASRIIGLREGKVVFDGLPHQLTDSIVEYIYGHKIEEAHLV